MVFRSVAVKLVRDGVAKLVGDLNLHGVTKRVELNVEGGKFIKDLWGQTRTGFTATGVINRKDFGLTWNKLLETGGLVAGEEVEIMIEVLYTCQRVDFQ